MLPWQTEGDTAETSKEQLITLLKAGDVFKDEKDESLLDPLVDLMMLCLVLKPEDRLSMPKIREYLQQTFPDCAAQARPTMTPEQRVSSRTSDESLKPSKPKGGTRLTRDPCVK